MITSAADLDELVEHVRTKDSFAFDTEFIGEETYYPQICLIQIATDDRVAVIDPLEGLDVSAVWELVADPALETIVHAGQIDLEPVTRLLNRPPARIFDTQIAAAFVGMPWPTGLRQLVHDLLGHGMGKGLTFTDWSRRPLSKAHLHYAADDVRFLPALREALRIRLDEVDHTRWVEEECGGLSDLGRYVFDAEAMYTRVIGNRNLDPKNRAVLRELVVLRDEIAREEDLPPRTLVRDDVLIAIARDPARDVDRLASLSGFPRPLARRHGARFLEAIETGVNLPPDRRPKRRSPVETPEDRLRIDSLWSITSAFCLGQLVDPAMVTSRREIARLYLRLKRRGRLDRPSYTGWREELLGRALRNLLHDGGRIELEWRDGRMISSCDSPATSSD